MMILAFIFLLFLYIYLQDIILPFTQLQNINNFSEYFFLREKETEPLHFLYLYKSLLYIIFILSLIVKNIKNK